MDQIHCMRVFIRIVEQGSFARAADDLGVSPATVTAALTALEKRLGARLLHRTTRKLSLTEEGRTYYEDIVRILGELAEAEDVISNARLSPRGRLRVSIAQSFEALSFFPLLDEFMQAYPLLQVEVIVTDRAVNMVEEGIDCALRAVEISADSSLIARKVLVSHWVTCATPDYLARNGRPHSIADLAQHNCIRFISPSTGKPREWSFTVNGERRSLSPSGKIAMTSLDGAVAAARAGAGIAQVPDVLAYSAILEGQLLPILTEHVVEGVPVMLAYPANRYLPARVRAFAAFFEKAYPENGYWPKIAAHLQAAMALVE